MSDGAPPPPVLLLPADLGLRDLTGTAPSWRRTDWPAILAALLLHLVVIAAVLVDWRLPPVVAPPEAVPVTIVFASPPAAAPAAPQPPAPRPFLERKSGNDNETTAPPSSETTDKESTRAPDAAAMAEPEPPKPQAAPAPAAEKPAPPQHDAKAKPHDAQAHVDARKEADRARSPHPAKEHFAIAPGDREQAGDPYLNRARDLIERHRTYPNVIGRYGVPVEGTSTYSILIDRKGGLRGIKLVDSSGTTALDDAGAAMIRETAPFPPLPADYPGQAVVVTITIHLFPKPAW